MEQPRPFIFVLAGVNGAGKSSIGGHLLLDRGLDWYNPDAFARHLRASQGLSLEEANGAAWQAGCWRLEQAIERGENYAFETTLGARTIPKLLARASTTHSVYMWYCGLATVEHHLKRIAARVASGGHDIPETMVRERWVNSRTSLVGLLPHLWHLQVYDNTAEAQPGGPIPNPSLVLEMKQGRLLHPSPRDVEQLASVPAWVAPIVEAALQITT
jgi:predicted ABC-type ATPase